MVNIWSLFAQIIGTACPLCGAPGDEICAPCDATLPRNANPCPSCALPLPEGTPQGLPCADCQAHPPAFDRALAPLLYAPPVDRLIAGFKYQLQLPLGRMLTAPLAATLRERGPLPELLLPIPAAASRLRRRGFNQAAEIARHLGRQLDLAWAGNRLLRVRDAGPQHELGRAQRRRNLRGAFACRGALPRHVALIDDVMTTGATADEASRILKRAGVGQVDVWAIARTPRE
jgi:ComF family protein